jgi:HAD superfamily hydrolase (TIGR01549 family)
VFDTLLQRNIEPPEYVKDRSARFAVLLVSSHGVATTLEQVKQTRDDEENRLRAVALSGGLDHECAIHEILHATLRALVSSEFADEHLTRWIEYELTSECEHLSAKPGAIDVLGRLKKAGKRIFLISDMYLRKRDLVHILRHAGLVSFVDDVFVSSENKLGKYSTRLFKAVLERAKIDSGEAIHVGDNYISDVVRPMQLGWHAVWLHEKHVLRRRRRLHTKTKAATDSHDWSIVASSLGALPALAEQGSHATVYQLGYNCLGLAYALFVIHVLDRAHELRIRDVYFLAREGRLFLEAAALLQEKVHRYRFLPKIGLHYLYVSRRSTGLPSIRQMGEREINVASFRRSPVTLRQLLVTYNLDIKDFAEVIQDNGLDPDAEIDGLRTPGLTAVLHDDRFKQTLERRRAESKLLLERYLEQEGFFTTGGKILCDVGWNGTIQINVTRAFGSRRDFPALYGAYFGRHDSGVYDYSSVQMLPGFAMDCFRKDEDEQAMCAVQPLFEMAAAASHPSTIGYRLDRDEVLPVFGPETPSQYLEARYALRQGVRDYIGAFAETYPKHEINPDFLRREAIRRVVRLIRRPTAEEARAVAALKHSVDWGQEDTMASVVSDKTGWTHLFRVRECGRDIRLHPWTTGTAATLGPVKKPLYKAMLCAFAIRRWLLRQRGRVHIGKKIRWR